MDNTDQCKHCSCYYLNCNEGEVDPDSECSLGLQTFRKKECDFFDELIDFGSKEN